LGAELFSYVSVIIRQLNKNNHMNIEDLLIRHFEEKTTDSENESINLWINKSEKNLNEFNQLKAAWMLSSRLIQMQDIDTIKAKKRLKSKIPEFNKPSKIWVYWQKIAAVIMIPIMASAIYYYFHRYTPQEHVLYREITSSYGVRTKLDLPDGTEVWLNSNSKLKFPERFNNEKREVFLSGEAFFNVAKDIRKPFYVNLGELSVKAIGTSFNVAAYQKENTYETTLISGEIYLVKHSSKDKEVLICKMSPNQHTVYNKDVEKIILYEEVVREKNNIKKNEKMIKLKGKSANIGMLNENKYTSWINGKLIFRNDPMDFIAKQLNRWYNVDIQLQDTLLYDFRYTATFTDESLEQVLELLSLSAPIEYKIINSKIKEDNSYSKRIVIIFLKRKNQ
jgi:transmembrane sensor